MVYSKKGGEAGQSAIQTAGKPAKRMAGKKKAGKPATSTAGKP